jgi:hypothetical protein
MSPSAFSFLGIKVYIFNNDHDPIHIHIHAYYAEFDIIIEIEYEDGKPTFTQRGDSSFPPAQKKTLMKFLKKHHKKVVEKWTELIILKKQIKNTRISGL